MKKTLLALAIAASATSVQAIEIYNNEGVTVGLHGDIEVVYKKDTAKDSEFRQEIQDADFGFDVRYAVNDEVSFGGYWEFDGASFNKDEGKNHEEARVGDTYVAFYTQSYGSVKIGRTCGALDDAGVGSDYQFGVSSFFKNGSSFCADEMVRYDLDKGMFYGTVSLAQDKHDVDKMGKDGGYFDLKAGVRVADFDFTVFYGDAELTTTGVDAKTDESILGLEGRFGGVENLNLELGYYQVDVKATGSDKLKADTIAFAADYTIDVVTLAAGYSISGVNTAGVDDVNNWFVNAGYGFAPNTTAYVEVGGNDETDSETGVAVGVKASF
ncbi:porin [Vibrio sp. ZSDE26]|uniref:Porin n=1 Tax=Vibrio amylolyticus TaxID=2847292 RepID=A0A9X2BKH3_9VIBR|nr:porin [Vibrio amylolyticus]MCK6262838.1 porin [Vibrio amylolyticus]